MCLSNEWQIKDAKLHNIALDPSPIQSPNHESPTTYRGKFSDLASPSLRSILEEENKLGREEKCSWLRSQLVGDDIEFSTPFGRRRLTYADHTASGRSVHYIEDFIKANVLPYYGNTHTEDSTVGSRTTKMALEAANYIKSCLGGKEDDALLFCGSGATAAIKRLQEVMGIAIAPTLRSMVLSILRPEERWVVFVGPYEHHSNLLSWRESLAEVVEVGVDGDGLIDIDGLRGELRQPKYLNRPMLGSFSACSNVTGIYSDTRALTRLLHEHGAFACFDFAARSVYNIHI